MTRRSRPTLSALPDLATVALSILIAAPAGALANEKTSISSGVTEAELTPEEKAEKEARKSCKVALCRAFRNPGGAPAGNVTCSIPKSWRKAQLDKMMSKAKVSWPWGPVVCHADIDIAREALAKAMSEAKYDLKLATHHVSCTVDRDKKDDAKIDIDFAPTVSFQNGKAVKAQINWGELSAPTLLKGGMWTATATDNTFNVLQSTLVEDINDFISNKCEEVKAEWTGAGP